MTPAQIHLVRSSWQQLLPRQQVAAALFYRDLFTLAPHLQALFRRDMAIQGAMLMAVLGSIVDNLNDLTAALPAARQLAIRHVAWGVKAAHYDDVGAALLLMLQQCLGSDFTPEHKQAWAAAYSGLAGVMKEAAYPPPTSCATAVRGPESQPV